jgi:hypothetical protein
MPLGFGMMDECGLQLAEQIRICLHRHIFLRRSWVISAERILNQRLGKVDERQRALPWPIYEQLTLNTLTPQIIRYGSIVVNGVVHLKLL